MSRIQKPPVTGDAELDRVLQLLYENDVRNERIAEANEKAITALTARVTALEVFHP